MYTHLIGTHNVKITDNMLTLPDNFISVFNGKCVLSRSFDGCMMIYPISVWNDFAERLSCLPDSKKSARQLKSYFFASAEEVDIYKRARNSKVKSHPSNTDIITYKKATGFEALFGYLYLNNCVDRIKDLVDYIMEV